MSGWHFKTAFTVRGRQRVRASLSQQLYCRQRYAKRPKLKPLRLQRYHLWRFSRRPLLP